MKKLLNGINYEILKLVNENPIFKGIEYDSRKIEKDFVFIALEGNEIDGHEYIDNAVKKGANTIIVSKLVDTKHDVNYILVKNLRKNMGIIASNFFDWPQNSLKIIGVTGTNGKTTSTFLIEALLDEKNVARIGTIDYKIGNEIIEAINTTPESLDLIKICDKIKNKGIEYLVMEVSSHALEIGRTDVLQFDIALFTNLTRDHLDFHKTMDSYFNSKKILFKQLKENGKRIINIDDPYGKKLSEEFPSITYGILDGDVRGKTLNFTTQGQKISITANNETFTADIQLLGKFNLYNILGAVASVLELGIDKDELINRLKTIKEAPGRFEQVLCGQDFSVIVDYAHSPDALENVLKSATELEHNKIILVFGCGGDRDKTKRPIMGAIASEFADIVIVTSDNPRTENPFEILKEVEVGIKNKEYLVEENREIAIKKAISLATTGDIVLITGKGHEDYQIIGKTKYHFDDREYVRKELILKKRG